jgi:hypothetical protein
MSEDVPSRMLLLNNFFLQKSYRHHPEQSMKSNLELAIHETTGLTADLE